MSKEQKVVGSDCHQTGICYQALQPLPVEVTKTPELPDMYHERDKCIECLREDKNQLAAEIERLAKLNWELLTALEYASAKMVSAGKCHPLAMPVLLGEAHEIIVSAIACAKERP